ncbi:hypothetical protein ALC57_10112 [Trachymyrmex cornetzi]|uniref:Uncharacterized protein n=1 Tax=Trachymyrmex cornetzi TaxID=471704 RepID=A0A151J4T7_9HYME|nr:hypothetical protein ALC57_10112 [Trachymyrmex cornetzi]
MDRVKEYIRRKIDRAQGVPSLTARSAKSSTTIEGKHHQRNQNISHKKPLLATSEPPIVLERC